MLSGSNEVIADRPAAPVAYRVFISLLVLILMGVTIYHEGPSLVKSCYPPVKLMVYGFSTQEEVFRQRIFPALEERWEARTNCDLIIEGVFGPSGTLANQIVLGAPADIAVFSNEQHVTWLQIGGQVQRDSRAEIIGSTPIIIVTRQGNPAGIRDFADLAQPDLDLLHAEPEHSGAGEWSLLAEYGSAWLDSGDQAAAEEQVKAIWRNVNVQGSSAREIMTLFELGTGDAMITYEQDALLALDRGVELEIITPPRTIVAQHFVTLVDGNVTQKERAVAQEFVRFLTSVDGQKIFRQFHLRPPEIESSEFPTIENPFTVSDLNGWSQAYHELVDGLWKTEIKPNLDVPCMPRLLDSEE